jgi:hypothetical protein
MRVLYLGWNTQVNLDQGELNLSINPGIIVSPQKYFPSNFLKI